MVKNKKTLNTKNNCFLNFFFPFFPIKVFRSLQLIFLIIFLICLRLIFGFIHIPITPFGISLSFAWVPLMVLGWYFGPITGLLLGMLTDTIGFLINGSLWYWMYAIQEPIVGFISGLIGSIARLRKDKMNHVIYDLIINQVVSCAFIVISFLFLIKWLAPYVETRNKSYISFYTIYKWIALGCLICFYLTYEVFTFLFIKRKKKNNQFIITFLYSGINVIIIITLFSFALGPITAISYLKFIGKQLPKAYLKIGSIFYLIPRIAIETIKTPIEIWLLFTIVCIFNKKINNLINKINNTWQNKYVIGRNYKLPKNRYNY